jgi:hypothetical protein
VEVVVMAVFILALVPPLEQLTQVVEVAVVRSLRPVGVEALVLSLFAGLNHNYHPLPQQEALR